MFIFQFFLVLNINLFFVLKIIITILILLLIIIIIKNTKTFFHGTPKNTILCNFCFSKNILKIFILFVIILKYSNKFRYIFSKTRLKY